MGCFPSKELDVNDPLYIAKQQDRAITEALQQANKARKVKKLLILGAGESGKSTVLKQLKILHKNGFSNEERLRYTQVIWADAVTGMCVLLTEARKRKIPLECDQLSSDLKKYRDTLFFYNKNILSCIDTDTAGGEQFINEYLSKYGTNNQYKRQNQSTGIVEAFDESFDEETDTLLTEQDNDSYYKHKQSEEFDGKSAYSSSNIDAYITGFIGKKRNNDDSPPPKMLVSRVQVGEAIHNIWTRDSGIKRIWDKRNEFQMESNANYYFDNIIKFTNEYYKASDDDILAARIKTTGIQETKFTINGDNFKILDAGGQRSERKKWLRSFDDITAVIFVLAVSEYDQTLFEDNKVNRIHESMMLFRALVNSRWFRDTPFILFLNKTDLFEEKIKKSSIKRYLPEYNGAPGNYEDGLKFFEDKLLGFNKTKKSIYVHRTCATDTKIMKFVLATVTDLFIQDSLKKSGMM